jgi:transposase
MSQENASNRPLIRYVNRQQMSWRAVDVERLIGEDHSARAIWTLVGRLDLSPFYRGIESSEEEGGRPAFDPQLLISLWVYAYSQGIGSAREVARRCEYDPAFQWLTGLQEVNYHTLADFRVERQNELDELFTQLLAALSKEGLITLEQVMQDGTKIRAAASPRSVQRESTIQEHWERARRRVKEMGDPQDEESSLRVKQARARAQREQLERLDQAMQELEKLHKLKAARSPRKRVSISDPEARLMKQPQGGLALSYNAQLSTDAAHGLIVGVSVTQAANDWDQLLPALQQIDQRLKQQPKQTIADAGYTTRAVIEEMAERKMEFLGSMPREDACSGRTTPHRLPPSAFIYQRGTDSYLCPGEKLLRYEGRIKNEPGLISYRYQARREDCEPCVHKPECCPENQKRGRGLLRIEESAAVQAFRQKMASKEVQASYHRRGRVAEFCNAWIKSKLGLRQFHVRGLLKVQTEMLWACITYNLQHWIRLRKASSAIAASC